MRSLQFPIYNKNDASASLPFGELFVSQRNTSFDSRYKFTAKELDNETNYTYFGARYYDSDISIWLSVDPLSDKYPSLSPYMYCAGNPVILVDPDGRGAVVTRTVNDDGNTVITVKANIYVYSKTLSSAELSNYRDKIQGDIMGQWNNPVNIDDVSNPNSVTYNNKPAQIIFEVAVIPVTETEAREQFGKKIWGDNFAQVDPGIESDFSGNTGKFDVHHLNNRGSSTAPHEFGHLLGYLNKASYLDITDKTHTDYFKEPNSIMTNPASPQLGCESSACLNANLANRRVTNRDIRRINNGNSFSSGNVIYNRSSGQGRIGSQSETF